MINPETVLQDRYLIEKRIGEGGMGAVYLAIDQRFDNPVAIKETFYKDEEFGDAFEREAKILNGLVHPVLPHVSDYFTEGDEHFLVMQYIEGEDASDILKRDGAFAVEDVLRWTDNLLDALDYLHSQEPPIIHRDLKPSNLKITARGDIFLLDFGLAKLKKENTLSERSVFGYSRRYSPLEQIQGTGTDARSDIFALAATVFHLLTGTPPVDSIARASAIVAGRPDPIRLASEIDERIPDGVANILNSALSLNAENRFASASAMRQALKHAVEGVAAENAEAAPVAPVTEPKFEAKIIDSAEDLNFPALESFAAEPMETPAQPVESVPLAAQTSPLRKIPVLSPSAFGKREKIGDVSTRVAPRSKKSSFPVVALVVLLAVAASVSAFFILRSGKTRDSSAPTPEISVSETKPDTVIGETVPDAVDDATVIENADAKEEKPKSAVTTTKKSAEKAKIEDEEPEVEAVVAENSLSHSKPVKAEVKSAETKRVAKKSNTTNIDRRERVVENAPVPDIESIFTGRPSWEREEQLRRRAERRRRIEEMSDEEYREMRRRRRQQRRMNNYPIPF